MVRKGQRKPDKNGYKKPSRKYNKKLSIFKNFKVECCP